MKTYTTLLFFIVLLGQSLYGFSLFEKYEKKQPEEIIKLLERKQVDYPNDPQVSYNLGVALYKVGDYKAAQTNFTRALNVEKDAIDLRKRCYFNLANSYYMSCLKILGDNWEERDLEVKILDEALREINQAIAEYKHAEVIDKKQEQAQANRKLAEQLKDKILRKKAQKEQKNQQQQDNKQPQDNKSDKQQQSEDKQKQEQDKQQGDGQQKQNGQQQGGQQPPDNSQNKDNNKQQQSDKQKQPDQDQQKNNKSQKDDKQDKQPGDNGGAEQKQKESEQEKQGSGQPQKQDEQKKESGQQQMPSSKKEQKQDRKEQKQQGAGQSAAPAGSKKGKEEEKFSKRQARAVLDNLEQQEADLQKALIYRNIHNRQQRHTTSQKPW